MCNIIINTFYIRKIFTLSKLLVIFYTPKGKFPNNELQVIKEYNTNIRFDSFKLQ